MLASAISNFYAVYKAHLLAQQEGLWLYSQCQEPEFFKKLAQHSDACQHLNELFMTSPWNKAMEDFTHSMQDAVFTVWDPLTTSTHTTETQATTTTTTSILNPLYILFIFILVLLCVIFTPLYLSMAEQREWNKLTIAVYHAPSKHKQQQQRLLNTGMGSKPSGSGCDSASHSMPPGHCRGISWRRPFMKENWV